MTPYTQPGFYGTYELRSNGERSAIFGPFHEDENELLIARGIMAGRKEFHRLLDTTSAESWLKAKVAFGEALTALQQRMVDGKASEFEVLGRWGYVDLTGFRKEPLGGRGRPKQSIAPDLAEALKQLWLEPEGAGGASGSGQSDATNDTVIDGEEVPMK